MSFALVFLVLLVATAGSAAMMAIIGYFTNRLKRLEGEVEVLRGGGGDSGRLHDEISLLQEEVRSLTERLDFTERLLQPAPDEKNPS